ncbi:ribosomal protein S6 kinase delta-1 [Frankliniella occidentalis]|uniref:Ribosomal protein S6 kinase delta-1 n=1 Tax=Frankliniella occidentalis TaxID=133901 RepID=A0A9C6U286_FRAOC|nr:ribosomal protein S6 kinase delta-1 [Frankliniella occidentalis]
MTDQWIRYFTVTDPRRHSKGFTVYKVTSTVFPRNSPEAKTEVVVWKRYKEFQILYKDLKSRHEKLYLKDQFPSFSKPRLFGRFESDVIEERRRTAQDLLDFTAKHPPLFTSQSCVKFFEKSQKVVLTENVLSENQQLCLLPDVTAQPTSESYDRLSQNSSLSSLTDTDSSTSIMNSPCQQQDDTSGLDSRVQGFKQCLTPTHDNLKFESENKQVKDDTLDATTVTRSCDSSLLAVALESDKQLPASSRCSKQHTSSNQSTLCPSKLNVNDTLRAVSDETTKEVLSPNNTTEDDFLTSLEVDYITQAGYHISQAVEHETNCKFEVAFASYKAAISCLLGGVLEDISEERKSFVQRKASQYLLRAEQIYHNHLDGNHNTTRSIPEVIDIPQLKDTCVRSWKSLEAPISDLKFFKVLGTVSSVILALDTRNGTPCIVKVLHKSSCPVDRRTKSIVPCNVPFMCRLHNFIENESAVYLFLEQARGGRLWDHISPYFEIYHSPESSRNIFSKLISDCATNVIGPISNLNNIENAESDKLVEGPEPFPLKTIPLNVSYVTNSAVENLKPTEQTHTSGIVPDISVEVEPASQTEIFKNRLSEVPSSLNNLVSSLGQNTEDIMKNSEKLLESVKKTLSDSEAATKALLSCELLPIGVPHQGSDDVNIGISSVCASPKQTVKTQGCRERLSLITRDYGRPISKDRKSASSRHSRSRLRFSCDDMFEGRARALSKSLDREALQRVHPRDDQGICLGLPIDTVRLWAAQLLLALDALHRWGVVIGDLRPDNLLLSNGLNLVLTYHCQWVCVDHLIHPDSIEQYYAAPEISSFQVKTVAADWWSYGAILFELLSGETLYSCHPGGFHSYSTLHIPSSVPEEGASLLTQLLRFEAPTRLGVGPHGVAKLKAHSFFKGIEWNKVLLMSASV